MTRPRIIARAGGTGRPGGRARPEVELRLPGDPGRRSTPLFFAVEDADLHDFRDSAATREVYVYDSARLGIRRNRARVLVRRDEVVAVTRFADIAES